jgi:hypothetical protein
LHANTYDLTPAKRDGELAKNLNERFHLNCTQTYYEKREIEIVEEYQALHSEMFTLQRNLKELCVLKPHIYGIPMRDYLENKVYRRTVYDSLNGIDYFEYTGSFFLNLV